MRILLVCATEAELQRFYSCATFSSEDHTYHFNGHKLTTLICGVGPALAAYSCGKMLTLHPFDLVINLGIAGCIHPEIPTGEAVSVVSDQFFMLGSEDRDEFISVFDLGLADPRAAPYSEGLIMADVDMQKFLPAGVRKVEGITVQCAHGNQDSIEKMKGLYPNASVESQEGAAVMMAARLSEISCMQFRGISNLVEPRNRDSWQIKPALEAVTSLLVDFLEQLPADK